MLWGILIGFAGTIAAEIGLVALLRWQIQRMEKEVPEVVKPGKLRTFLGSWADARRKKKDAKRLAKNKPKATGKKWDGKYVIFKSNGEPLPPDASCFIMQYEKRGHEPERQAMNLYADLVADTDPDLSKDIKKKLKQTQVREELEDE